MAAARRGEQLDLQHMLAAELLPSLLYVHATWPY